MLKTSKCTLKYEIHKYAIWWKCPNGNVCANFLDYCTINEHNMGTKKTYSFMKSQVLTGLWGGCFFTDASLWNFLCVWRVITWIPGYSQHRKNDKGAPQAWILGSLFFNRIIVRSFLEVNSADFWKFFEDNIIYACNEDLESLSMVLNMLFLMPSPISLFINVFSFGIFATSTNKWFHSLLCSFLFYIFLYIF